MTCDSYTLPPLTNGNYFTSSGGLGNALQAGDAITSSQTIFVFSNDGRCTNESSFKIDIINSPLYVPISQCGSFTLPQVTVGSYYESPGGQGKNIPAGTVITSSQTIYYYAPTTTTPNCTENLKYVITIYPLPLVDTPANRLECSRYVLPPLVNGNYFTKTDGGGTALKAGDIISSTQTIYVFSVGPQCTNEHSFTIEIRPLPPVDSFTDVVTCNDFILPKLKNGKYYTATGGPNGLGSQLTEGTVINTTQTIYIYNAWPDFASCSNETFFKVNYNGIDVGNFSNINVCDSYTLPTLTLGNYYTQPGGKGAVIPAGTVITNSQTIYVYAIVGNRLTCVSEKSFTISISQTPLLASAPDVAICESYILPPLAVGNYYSAPNAAGTQYTAGQKIITSQKIYIYAASPTNSSCFAQDDFDITIYPLKNFSVQNGVICVDFQTGTLRHSAQLNSGINSPDYTVEWYFNDVKVATGPTYDATQEGIYTVVPVKNISDVGNDCGYNSTTVTVEKSSQAIATVTVSDDFTDNIDITVNLTNGFGVYEYQLDDGDFQTSNIFQNVDSGEHALTIRDIKANCDNLILFAKVLKYPKFFTPNNDGYNDTWNIPDLAYQPDAVITIFDRYGKLLKIIKPSGAGWDGNFDGAPLPSSDYWFHATYTQNGIIEEFRAHFSIKR